MAAAIKQPGWYRGALGALLGAAFGYFLVVGLRLLMGLDATQTEQTGYPQIVVPLITTPSVPSPPPHAGSASTRQNRKTRRARECDDIR